MEEDSITTAEEDEMRVKSPLQDPGREKLIAG